MPFCSLVFPVQPRDVSPAARDASNLLYTRSSSRPVLNMLQLPSGFDNGPLGVPAIPSGKDGVEIPPSERVEKAIPFAKAPESAKKVCAALTYALMDEACPPR